MRRRKALGVVFAYEGLQLTSEADFLDWRREGYSFTQLGHSSPPEKKTLDREGTGRPETGRPGNPITDPGGKAGAASFGHPSGREN